MAAYSPGTPLSLGMPILPPLWCSAITSHESLKTAPRGYPQDHPRIDLLRQKGIIGWWEHPPRKWLATPTARQRVADGWRALGPLNAWLDANVGAG